MAVLFLFISKNSGLGPFRFGSDVPAALEIGTYCTGQPHARYRSTASTVPVIRTHSTGHRYATQVPALEQAADPPSVHSQSEHHQRQQ